MNLTRRAFTAGLGAAGASSLLPRGARAARENELNILCWEGYNTDDVLGPFPTKRAATDAAKRAVATQVCTAPP